MRIILFLLISLLSMLLEAQQQEQPSIGLLAEVGRVFRTGIAYRRDGYDDNRYYWKSNLLIPTFRRSDQWSLTAQWQILPQKELLFLLLEGSYQQDKTSFNERQLGQSQRNYAGPNFRESFDYKRFVVSTGIQMEFLGDYTFSPYFNAKLLFVLPHYLHYDYVVTNNNNIIGLPLRVMAEDGAIPSVGWEVEVGFRLEFSPHALFFIGRSFQKVEQKIDWPTIESRNYKDVLLGFRRASLSAGISYIWY